MKQTLFIPTSLRANRKTTSQNDTMKCSLQITKQNVQDLTWFTRSTERNDFIPSPYVCGTGVVPRFKMHSAHASALGWAFFFAKAEQKLQQFPRGTLVRRARVERPWLSKEHSRTLLVLLRCQDAKTGQVQFREMWLNLHFKALNHRTAPLAFEARRAEHDSWRTLLLGAGSAIRM